MYVYFLKFNSRTLYNSDLLLKKKPLTAVLMALILVTLFSGCKTEQKSYLQEIVAGSDILGLASPVKLDFEKTRIYLLDYFEKAEMVDSVYFDGPVDFNFLADSAVVLVNEYADDAQITMLSVVYNGTTYDIPVFKNRNITYKFTYESQNEGVNEVGLKGNFNGWNHKASLLSKDDETWTTELVLTPGLYEYLVVENGQEMLDPNNSNRKDNGKGGFNSTFRVGQDGGRPQIATYGFYKDSIFVHFPERLHAPIILWENQQIDTAYYHRRGDRLAVAIPNVARDLDRSHIRVYAFDDEQRTNDLFIPLEKGTPLDKTAGLNRADKHSFAMYFMMVDRFVNGDLKNDMPVNDPGILPPANYFGGDLAGVQEKIRDDYFKKLGMNTLWLSPIAQNPYGAYGLWDKDSVKSKFSGYHGYWPISSSQVDTRFGTEKLLMDLTENAHKNNLNVILDYVANHVHQEHPVYAAHPDWATELYLPDGTLNTERWDEHRLTTWFDTFMPTLDLERPEVVAAMTDSALFWFENYPIDGFRHDATKHVATGFWRELTRKLKYRVALPENRSVYQIGETYGNPELIGSYIGSGMLDGQFDFNLYDAAVAAFAKPQTDMRELTRVLNQGLIAYGDHHLMGNISGNQDRTRFISYADGAVSFAEDAKQAGWSRDIQIQDPVGYKRLAALHAFNFTVPGIPVIYYGDEIGMPGAGDPDNRRMMRFGKDLNKAEKDMLDLVTKIATLRRDNIALIYGDYLELLSEGRTLAYLRNYFNQTAIVVFNASAENKTITVDVPVHFNIDKLKANFGNKFSVKERTITVTLPAESFEILTN